MMHRGAKAPLPHAEPLPALRDNYIWVLREGQRVVVVDPGEAEPVSRMLATTGSTLVGILITHHHWDHTDGIAALVDHAACPVYGPAGEDIPGRTHGLREGDTVTVLGHDFAVVDIPGHTAGHIAFVGEGVLFCGDTLFGAGCGRLFEGSPGQMLGSLMKLAALPGDTAVHCGHEYTVANLHFAQQVEPGNATARARLERAEAARARGLPTLPSTIAEECATNPFLRCDAAEVVAAAEARAGHPLPNAVEVFATVRRWKDSA